MWSQWGLLLRSGGEGGDQSRPHVSAAVIYLEFRLYSSPCCHSVPSPGHITRPLLCIPPLQPPMIDVSREAPQGGAKRSYIPHIMPRGRSQTLTLLAVLLLLLPPGQPVLYTTTARGWSESEITPHISHSHLFSSSSSFFLRGGGNFLAGRSCFGSLRHISRSRVQFMLVNQQQPSSLFTHALLQ